MGGGDEKKMEANRDQSEFKSARKRTRPNSRTLYKREEEEKEEEGLICNITERRKRECDANPHVGPFLFLEFLLSVSFALYRTPGGIRERIKQEKETESCTAPLLLLRA
jgi:hypothetical protein